MVHTFAIALDSTTVWLEATLSPKMKPEVFLHPQLKRGHPESLHLRDTNERRLQRT